MDNPFQITTYTHCVKGYEQLIALHQITNHFSYKISTNVDKYGVNVDSFEFGATIFNNTEAKMLIELALFITDILSQHIQ